jgi:hypothetical protein
MTVVSLPGCTPYARYDGNPWTEVQIGEATPENPTGPFTTIDTIALSGLPGGVDSDPTNPQTRDLTTVHATLTAGWYQVTFLDADSNTQVLAPMSWPPVVEEPRPLLVPLDKLKKRLGTNKTANDDELEDIIRGCTLLVERLTAKKFFPNPAKPTDDPVTITVQVPGTPPPRMFAFGQAAWGTPLAAQPMAAEVPITIPHASSLDLDTITLNETVLTSDQYLLEPDSTLADPYIRRVVILDPAVLPAVSLTVTGWFGIWPPPDDLVDALLSWCARRYKERDAAWGDQVQMPDGGVITYYRQLPPNVQLAVDSYCEVTM